MNHLDEDAELYALGLTEREHDAAIEAHLAQCEPCRDRVVAAEAAAAAMSAALPPMPAAASRRRTLWPGLATAAAVVFAASTAFEGNVAHTAATQLQRTDVALGAIASTHFAHTTLAAAPGVVAKVLYARDGAWCYAVVSGAPRGAHLIARSGAAAHDLGALDAGAPATLFVRAPGHADEFDIVAGDHVVAHGAPAY